MEIKKTLTTLATGALIGAALVWYIRPPETKIEKVVEVQERERVRTIVEERPDGSKTTIIDEERQKDSSQREIAQGPKPKDWAVTLQMPLQDAIRGKPVYGLGVERRLILDLSVGAYGRTDGEWGLLLSYRF